MTSDEPEDDVEGLDPMAVQAILLAWARQHEAVAKYLLYWARTPSHRTAQELVWRIPELDRYRRRP